MKKALSNIIKVLNNFFVMNNIFLMLTGILMLSSNLSHAQDPFAVPTFHCMSLYWSPSEGKSEKDVLVSYKKSTESVWMEGLPMRYHPIHTTTIEKSDYRGSVVNLTPDTSYDFKLTLEGTETTKTLSMATWSEIFPEGTTVYVENQSIPFDITTGGSPDAYRVFDGQNNTINVNHQHQYCIKIDASYVIVRNFVLKGAGTGIGGWPYIGNIQIEDGVHDIIIEYCDISDFGRPHPNPKIPNHGFDRDCGISFFRHKGGKDSSIERVIIQRNKIHSPTHNTNDWDFGHPQGPQGITMWNNNGNHVIRYNEIYSDIDHLYNDIISGGENASYRGVPGPDSDIYCNYLSHSVDDAIEVEGGVENVRVWNNYVTQAPQALGNAPVSIGPLYFWRNVFNLAEWKPGGRAGRFIKMGTAGSVDFITGHMYIFNNTAFQENDKGIGSGIGGGNRIIKHCVTRNNIIHSRNSGGQSISLNPVNINNDFDYDLYNGLVPSGSQSNGIFGIPVYVKDAGYNSSAKTGNFQLFGNSPGKNAGAVIPNFTDGYNGSRPDIGAHETGWPDFQYGINAVFIIP